MTPTEILRDLARDDLFPKAAMVAARAQRDVLAPMFVDLVRRLAAQPLSAMTEEDLMALLPVFHLLGEWREPRAYRPLLQMLRRPRRILDHLLDDAVTETSFRVIAGTFDGDLQPLLAAIEDRKADVFARNALLCAMVLIAQVHPGQRPAIEDVFRSFRRRCPMVDSVVLTGWMEGVADLGLADMTEAVRAVFAQGLIPKDYCDFSHFLEDLQATQAAQGAPGNRRYRCGLIEDAIEELSRWHCYSDAFLAQRKLGKVDSVLRLAPKPPTPTPPKSSVGRNDPCPCGSGKKFKKCCLQ